MSGGRRLLTDKKLKGLKEEAKKVRVDIIKMISNAGSGHPGGALSVTDMLV